MKRPYETEVNKLQKWIEDTDRLICTAVPQYTRMEVQRIRDYIFFIAENVSDEYAFYSAELPRIADILFNVNMYGVYSLNIGAFGELFIIMKQISKEPINLQFWENIHPRIAKISKEIFCDGHFASAAEKALKEIETKLREMFKELKPEATVPAKILEVMRALLTENGAYHYCDTSTVSGKNYCKGVCALFEGTFAAYRNPASHENLNYTKREAVEQITLASQLMYILTNPRI